MEVKVTFGFRRNDYSEEAKVSIDRVIKMELERKLKGKGITTYRIYTPNRNTVKVVFISEDDLNKVFDNKDYFMNAGLTPKTNISLKTSRTVFCGDLIQYCLLTTIRKTLSIILKKNIGKLTTFTSREVDVHLK